MRLKVILNLNLLLQLPAQCLTTASQPCGRCQCTLNCETLLRHFNLTVGYPLIHVTCECVISVLRNEWPLHILLPTPSYSNFKKKTKRWGKKVFSSITVFFFFLSQGTTKLLLKLLNVNWSSTQFIFSLSLLVWKLFDVTHLVFPGCFLFLFLCLFSLKQSWHPRAYWTRLQE